MENAINTGSLETLTPGQTLIVQARKVNGNKLQLEFGEVLEGSARPQNTLGMFNQSDDRFNITGKARRAWLTCEQQDAENLLGIDLGGDYTTNEMGHVVKPLNVLNPVVNGQRLRVQIVETTEASEWNATHIESDAKRKGKDGDFITHKGMYIFTQSSVVVGDPTNVFLEADAPSTTTGIMADQNVSVETGEIFS
tara:strand:+ start:7633 stop:8217 length:585 start_codon:yes stop_codon:yes gene_type:complete